MAFLAFDVGNTRLKWALYDAAKPRAALLAGGVEFLENIEKLSEGAWAKLPEPQSILGCIVAGDAVRRRVQDQLEVWKADVKWVVPGAQAAGLINGYDHPSRLGADRWVAMIGARTKMQHDLGSAARPLVVVMVGTAVTVDAIDADGRFLGGFILPGHGIMLKALFSGTAGLHVPTGEVKDFPTNTSDALTSGGTFAIAGAVLRMMQHLREKTGTEPLCYMSGGAAWKMAPCMGFDLEIVESLIFDGLLELASQSAAAN